MDKFKLNALMLEMHRRRVSFEQMVKPKYTLI